MIFERGWFLHKMNKFAPRGYKFVANGPDGRIAMYSSEFMGDKNPSGPFVSCFSFDMLDNVYGGLLTRRSSHISQGAPLSEYLFSYNLGKPLNIQSEEKYEIYRSTVSQHVHTYCRPHPFLIRKNAIFIRALQDSNAYLPDNLNMRLNNYVNKCTWYAIEKLFSSMLICDMKYYQEQYRTKMQELGIVRGERFGALDVEKFSREKRYENLTVKIEELKYDILPRQEKSLARAVQRESAPEKQQQLQSNIAKTQSILVKLTAEQQALGPKTPSSPAKQILSGTFYAGGTSVIPKISSNKFIQMLQLLMMRETKIKNK